MMQILTEAGWSLIAYDHAARHKDYFFVVMLYFIVAHICIVLVLATLLKGLLWEVYFAIYNIHKANIVKTQLELYEDDVSGCDSLA